MISRKAAELENLGKNFSEMLFATYSRKTGNYCNKSFFKNCLGEIGYVKL